MALRRFLKVFRGPIVAQTPLEPLRTGKRNGLQNRPQSVSISGIRCPSSSGVVFVGTASQAEGRGFETRRPLVGENAAKAFLVVIVDRLVVEVEQLAAHRSTQESA